MGFGVGLDLPSASLSLLPNEPKNMDTVSKRSYVEVANADSTSLIQHVIIKSYTITVI